MAEPIIISQFYAFLASEGLVPGRRQSGSLWLVFDRLLCAQVGVA